MPCLRCSWPLPWPALLLLVLLSASSPAWSDECHLTPVIHVLQYPGCTPKPIPSYACTGRCTSYVQVCTAHILLCILTQKYIFLDKWPTALPAYM